MIVIYITNRIKFVLVFLSREISEHQQKGKQGTNLKFKSLDFKDAKIYPSKTPVYNFTSLFYLILSYKNINIY